MPLPAREGPLGPEAQRLYDLLPAGVCLLAPDGRFLGANAAYCRCVGYSQGELLALHAADLGHPADRERDRHELSLLAAGASEGYSVQQRLLRRDGAMLWVDVHARAVRDADGGLRFAIAVVRDIGDLKQAERELDHHEARFRTITDAMPQMVWSTRADGWHDYYNQQWYEFTGAPPGATDGGAWLQLFHPDDQLRVHAAWRHSLATGETYEQRYRLRHRSGGFRWVLGRAVAVRDAAGCVVRWMGTSTDIHAQKLAEDELRRSEAHLWALFEQSAAGVAEADIEGRLLAVNDRYCEITGRGREELLHMRAQDFTHPDDVGGNEQLLQGLLGGRSRYQVEKRYLRPDGTAVWLCVAVSLVRPAGEPPTVLAILFDISERKRIEQELQDADRRKDEFLAMLAHELRNPLAPIGAAAALLKSGRLGPARTAHVSEVIDRQVQHMTALVNDLLDVSRVTRGVAMLEMGPVDAQRIVADAVDQVRPVMEARRHVLAVDAGHAPVPLLGDHKRLVQVLVNLLNNAAKFTHDGGRIGLSMQVREGRVAWTVTDNGIGMPPDLVGRAFELFTQAERTSDRSQGGLGIGLALVKSLVELHHGTVTARSAGPGLGSEFLVELPLAPDVAPQAGPGETAPQARDRALRVLVVDDNVDAATLLAMVLEDMGHEALVEHDSAGALQRALRCRPHVCLLDIGLPDLDGNGLARRLRAMPETRDALLVAVTGYGQDRDREQSAAAGFDHHFTKPVDPGPLAAVLAEAARQHGIGDAA